MKTTVCFFVVALLLAGCEQPIDKGKPGAAPLSIRGTPAEDFNLPDLEGTNVGLRSYRGKVVLLNFWYTTCAPCISEIPLLIEFQKKYGDKGLQVVAVSIYENAEELKPFVAQHGMAPLKVLVGNDELAARLGVDKFPMTFLVDREGNYHSRHLGEISRQKVDADLAYLLERE